MESSLIASILGRNPTGSYAVQIGYPADLSRECGNPVKYRVAPWATLYITGCRNESGMTGKAGDTGSQERESACKPGSVKDNHSSGMYVAIHLLRPTRGQCGQHYRPLIWPCSRRGLPCRACCQPRGALLPHHFTLTRRQLPAGRYIFCCTFRRLAPPRNYLAPCPYGARTFLCRNRPG